MATTDEDIAAGQISSYENAPDTVLTKRSHFLRERLRHPRMLMHEWINNIIGTSLISGATTFFSTWFGIPQLVDRTPAIAKRLHYKGDRYVSDIAAFNEDIRRIADDFAETHPHFIAKGSAPKKAVEVLDAIEKSAVLHGFEGDSTRLLREFRKELARIHDPQQARAALLGFLKKNNAERPNAYVSLFADLFVEADELIGKAARGEASFSSSRKLVEALKGISKFTDEIVATNKIIMNAFRNPLTQVLAAGATVATCVQAYRATRENGMLQDEAALSHIERLMHERAAMHSRQTEGLKAELS